jgi:hypothetical protein
MSEQPAPSAPQTSPCPWCSAVSPVGTETCPSCGAALIASGADAGVPGVTSIDAEAVLRGGRTATKSRGGLFGFLSGETGDTVDVPSAAELSSLAPPATDVRIEMMRLELEAERQRIEAEAAGLAADAVVDGELAAIPPGVVTSVDESAWDVESDGRSRPTGSGSGSASTPPGPTAAPGGTPPPGPTPS